jgi:hypothetical protein
MGRPADFKNRKGITGYIELEEFKDLEEIRWREHKDFSDILRLAIQEYIMNHKEGNDTFKMDDWQTDPNFKAIPTLLGPDDKWMLCLKNCSDEELLNIYVGLKKRRVQVVTEEINRCKNSDRIPRWKYEKYDMPIKSHVPMLLGDKK